MNSPDRVDGCAACSDFCRFKLRSGGLLEVVNYEEALEVPEDDMDEGMRDAQLARLRRARASVRSLVGEAVEAGCPNVSEVLEQSGVVRSPQTIARLCADAICQEVGRCAVASQAARRLRTGGIDSPKGDQPGRPSHRGPYWYEAQYERLVDLVHQRLDERGCPNASEVEASLEPENSGVIYIIEEDL